MQEEIGIRTAEAACFGQQIQLNGLHVRSCLVLGGEGVWGQPVIATRT